MPVTNSKQPFWTLDLSCSPPSFLPEGLDTSDFIDITTLSDPYKVYLDDGTGKIHRGEDYIKKAREEGCDV